MFNGRVYVKLIQGDFFRPHSVHGYTISKSKMISRRQGGGDEAYYIYVEEADDAANKDSALIENWYEICS
jgi:hypothetical protein